MTGAYQIRDSEHGLGRVFIPCGPWQSSFGDVIRRERIAGLRLSDSMGWRGHGLQFVAELPLLQSFELYSWQVSDASILSSLSELRLLGVEADLRGELDFGPLSKLEVALLRWVKPLEGVTNCRQLRHFNVSSWPDADLARLAQLTKLQVLHLYSRKLQSLRGIAAFPHLERLDLHGCPKLTSLEGVETCRRLTSVSLSACRIDAVSIMATLPSLRTLALDSCGDLKTLSPLTELRELESLSFNGNTRVLDGDLSVLERLPKLRALVFAPRRSYNRTRLQLLER